MELQIHHQVSLKKYNTFGIDTTAENFIEINHPDQLKDVFEQAVFEKNFFVIGGGSNVLFTKPFEGYLLKINNKGIQYEIKGDEIFVTAQAGEVWNDFVWYCIDHGFGGVENMALIPGTVGAAPVQNIGAYGTELMYIFDSCRAFNTKTGEIEYFQNEDCKFSYRDSIFKSEYKKVYIITEVTFRLQKNTELNTSYGAINNELLNQHIENPSIADVAKVVSKIRVEKLPDPSMIGNAGSFFKNPVISNDTFELLFEKFPSIVHFPMPHQETKLAAGWLIEQCGWKGKSIGNAGVWKNQSLVLVNHGNATGQEIYALSTKIKDDVYKKFGIQLEREVNIL